ncbi:MAG: thioredoxin family protein [Methanobacteriaceae archaeon]|jgi:thiol:disulfide interchange protein DsbD|nr:thioredoxin family protein [Methanobacteriaceae archaeon]
MNKYILGMIAIIIILGLGVFLSSSGEVESESISDLNISTNLTQSLNDSEKLNKPVMIFFTSDSCYYCDEFKDKTLSDDRVVSKINNEYIFVSVNIKNDPQSAQEFEAYSTPTIVILNPEGDETFRLVGYKSPDEFLSSL